MPYWPRYGSCTLSCDIHPLSVWGRGYLANIHVLVQCRFLKMCIHMFMWSVSILFSFTWLSTTFFLGYVLTRTTRNSWTPSTQRANHTDWTTSSKNLIMKRKQSKRKRKQQGVSKLRNQKMCLPLQMKLMGYIWSVRNNHFYTKNSNCIIPHYSTLQSWLLVYVSYM